MTADQLLKAIPGLKSERLMPWWPHFEKGFETELQNKPERVASFMANVLHETALLTKLEENLNYTTPERIVKMFSSRVKGHDVNKLVRNPKALGDVVYKGYQWRGRGPFHLTWEYNYKRCGHDIGIDLVSNPDIVATPEVGALTAFWYWEVNGLQKWADVPNFDGVIRSINPAMVGKEERWDFYRKILRIA